jgi:hypothetical protein
LNSLKDLPEVEQLKPPRLAACGLAIAKPRGAAKTQAPPVDRATEGATVIVSVSN